MADHLSVDTLSFKHPQGRCEDMVTGYHNDVFEAFVQAAIFKLVEEFEVGTIFALTHPEFKVALPGEADIGHIVHIAGNNHLITRLEVDEV